MKSSSNKCRWTVRALVALLPLLVCSEAMSHFIWLAPCNDHQTEPTIDQHATSLQVFFGEEAAADDPDLLDLIQDIKVQRLTKDGAASEIAVQRQIDTLEAKLPGDRAALDASLFVATHDLGIRSRGGEAFRLVYHAKAGPPADAAAWSDVSTEDALALDVVPAVHSGRVHLTARFRKSPAVAAEVKATGPGLTAPHADGFSGETDAEGKASFAIAAAGRYSIRVRHIEATSGKVEDEAYDSVRHYTTITLDVPPSMIPLAVDEAFKLPDLPVTLTSFGGAVLGDDVYIYGGTKGSAHDYYKGIQSGALMRLKVTAGNADTPPAWETISTGPELQGLALVPHAGKLYRIGGFEARNRQGEEDRLWSVDSVACFDPASSQWTQIAPLPEPRSSFDAAVLGDTVYVVGGWSMQGEARRVWHATAWKLDLAQEQPAWQAIAKAPFERRALTVAAHEGKLYAIGGITSGDETVRETDVYDPLTDQWTQGPELVGTDGMTGFGASAFATGGGLYVSTVSGSLQRLSNDGETWQVVGQTPSARFFHRMLPIDEQRFILIGGSNMSSGRNKTTEVFAIP